MFPLFEMIKTQNIHLRPVETFKNGIPFLYDMLLRYGFKSAQKRGEMKGKNELWNGKSSVVKSRRRFVLGSRCN